MQIIAGIILSGFFFLSDCSAAVLTVSPTQTICKGDSVILTASGPGFVSYTWTPSTGLNSTTGSTVTAGPLASITYTVTGSDAGGATQSATIVVNVNPIPILSGIALNASCGNPNGIISLTLSGGGAPYSCLWSNGSTLQSLTGLLAGTYSVTVTNSFGCTAAHTYTVNSAGIFTSSYTQVNNSCSGGSNGSINISVSACGGGTCPYTYLWTTGATTQDINNLSSGTYTITIFNSVGCTNVQTIVIISGSLTLSSAITSSGCNNNSGTINLTVSGGTLPYSFNWSNGATTQNLTGLSAGVYSVTATDATGCTGSLSNITITQPPVNFVQLESIAPSCGLSNGTAEIDFITGGGGPFTYLWNNGGTDNEIDNLPAGTYSVTVTNSFGCTSSASILLVTSNGPLLSSTQINVCSGVATGMIDLSVNGGTAPFTYSWSNGATVQDIFNLTAGNYTVTVTDANNCEAISTITINQNASAVLSQTNINSTCGLLNGSIDLSVVGTGPFSYLWNNTSTIQDLTLIGAGAYTVTVTDGNFCTSSLSVTVNNSPGPTLIFSPLDALCNGSATGNIGLIINGGTSPFVFLWSNGATTQNNNNILAGIYTVTVTDANNCSSLGGVIIHEPLPNLLTETHIDANCGASDGSIDLTVTGANTPFTYLWNNAVTNQDLAGLSTGLYTVTVTDFNSCTNALSVSIANTGGLTLTETHTNIFCNGNNSSIINLTVNGGTGPYTFNWSNAATTQNISNLSAGNYTVTVTDFNNCLATLTVTISEPVALTLNETHVNPNCGTSNGSINLTVNGGTGSYSYNWSNLATTQDITNLNSGTYSVTVTDANFCTNSLSVTLTGGTGPTLTETHVNANCGIASGSINLTVTGVTPPYFYLWSNAFTTQDISNLIGGVYTVTVTDINFCTTILTINLPSTSAVTLQTTVTNVSCFGFNDGAINLTPNGGTPAYTYHWNTNATTQDLNNIGGNVYSVTVTDVNGCTATTSATVAEHAQVTPSQTHVNATCGLSNGSINLSVIGGWQPYNYIWNNGATTQDLAGLSAGNYSVTVSDFNSCTAVLSVAIVVTSGPSTQFTTTSILCNGASTGAINLTVSGGTAPYTYLWSNNSTTQDLNNIIGGNYSVTVTDANNCSVVGSVTVTQPTALQINESHVDASCGNLNGSIDVTVNGGNAPYTFLWSNAVTTEDLSNLTGGNFTITVTDANNCTATLQITILNSTAPTISQSHSDENCNQSNGSIDLTINNGLPPYSFNWSNGSTTEDLVNLAGGNYTVTVTDANGCSVSQTIILNNIPGTQLSETHVNANCGVSNGSINLTVSSGTGPYVYNWSNSATTQDLTNISSATYTVTVTDANNCTNSLSVTLTNGTGPTLSETHIDANCGIASGSIDLTVTGITPPYFYVWSNAFTTQDISNLIGGVYTVTVTDINFCTTILSINLPSTSAVTLQTSVTDVTCFGFNDGAIDLTANGGTPAYTYHWNTNATTQDLNGISGNVYTVTVTDLNGCTATTSATVIEHAQLSPSQIHVNATCGLSNGSIDLSVIGGYQPYSYVWNTNATSQDLTGLSGGNYSVTVSDFNSCTSVLNVTIGVTSGPSVQFTTTSVLCNGASTGSIDLTVSGGTAPYNYLWSNNSATQDLNNIPSGNYTVTVTDANNCSVTGSVTVTQPSAVQISETHVNATCGNSNGSIDVTVNGGTAAYTFLWSNTSTTEDLSALAIGNYVLTVTDANNCTSSVSIAIINGGGSLPLSSVIVDETCSSGNGSIDLSVNSGTAPFNYMWSNSATTEDIDLLVATTYSVTVNDAAGCTGSTSIIISDHPAPQLSATHTDETCSNSNATIDLTVTGGTSSFSYLWNNNLQTEDLSNLSAGNYTVTVTDANNCTVTLQVLLLNSSAPTINQIHDDENCNQSNGSINLTVNNGFPPYNFIWSNGLTTEDISNLSAGNYTVTVTDANGCSVSQTIILNNIAGPQLSETHVATSCGLNNGSIDLTITGGAQPFNYLWSNSIYTQNQLNISANTYSVTVTDASGCSAILSGIVINPSTSPSITETHTSSTCGNANAAIDLTVSNGTSPYDYLWNNNSITEDLTNILSGNYSVTVTDFAGCTVSLTATVGNITGPLPAAIATATSCGNNDGNIDLTVNGGTAPYNYLWNNSSTTEDVNSLAGGTFSVTVTDANGCTATVNSDVIASTYPVISASISGNKGCLPLNVFFTNSSSNAVSFNWIFGDGGNSNAVSTSHEYNQTGNFVVELIATSSTGCIDTLDVDTVSIYETPIADYTCAPWINETTLLSLAQFQFTNQSVFASTYLWNFGNGDKSNEINPVYTYTTEGNFYVTLYAFNANGCADTITYGPFSLIADGDIFVPNTFTPNGDHINDVFKIYGTGITAEHISIYDRWGEKLFESSELFSEWDGKYKDMDLNTGVYVYMLEVTRYDGTVELKNGDVTLLR